MNIQSGNDSNSADMGNMIATFKQITDNPLAKYFLLRTLSYCEEDKSTRLESALRLYLGTKTSGCYKCKLMSKMLAYIIKKGAKSFGTPEEYLKNTMQDDYWIKGLRSVLEGIALFGVRKPFIPGAPFQIVWNITKACNMKCIHCYEAAGNRDTDELSSKEVIQGLDTLSKAGVTSIAFSGGEPSIHPNIIDYIGYSHNKGIYVAMATNGYILADKDRSKNFVDAGLEFVQISLDGICPDTHDSFRGVDGAWNKAVCSVENFVDAGIFVEVATTVTEHNKDEITEMIDFVRDLGARWFMLYNFIPAGKGSEIIDMDLSPVDRSNILKTAYNQNNDKMQILSTAPQYAVVASSMLSEDSNMIPTHFYNPEYSNPLLMQLAEFIGGCGAGRFYMSIEPNGDMYPCVFFPHKEDVKLGNLKEKNFKEIWVDNDVLNVLRNKEILEGHCGVCESRNICGGCRARAYNYFDDISAPDPGCINNEEEWKKLKNKISHENINFIHPEHISINLEAKNND